jgi:U3 small nucleolar ribonucleoprotein protein IMP3
VLEGFYHCCRREDKYVDSVSTSPFYANSKVVVFFYRLVAIVCKYVSFTFIVSNMSMRKLKHHEKKLLKKVDFLWQRENNLREIQVMRRYHINNRQDYHEYNKVCGMITKLVNKLKSMDKADEKRIQITNFLLDKLYFMGLTTTKKSLSVCEKLPASALCRRRFSVVVVRLKFCETLKEAVTFIEHGHFRVGPVTVKDPGFLVTRSMEDHVAWVDSSKVKRTVDKYNDRLDDYDLLQA